MKRFKQFLIEKVLNEGLAKIRKQYHLTKRIDDYGMSFVSIAMGMNYHLSLGEMEPYGDWLANFYIKNKEFLNKHNSTDDLSDQAKKIGELASRHIKLKKRGAKPANLPAKTRGRNPLGYLDEFIEGLENKFYASIKSTDYPEIKGGEDYLYLRKGPIEVFSLLNNRAARTIGKGTRWCISETDPGNWDEYIKDGFKFRVIIDHREMSNSDYRKVAVTYDGNQPETFYSRDDSELGERGKRWYKSLGLTRNDLPSFKAETSYGATAREIHFNMLMLKSEVNRLIKFSYNNWEVKIERWLENDENNKEVEAQYEKDPEKKKKLEDESKEARVILDKMGNEKEFIKLVKKKFNESPPELIVNVFKYNRKDYVLKIYDHEEADKKTFEKKLNITDYVTWMYAAEVDESIPQVLKDYYTGKTDTLPKPPGAE